MDQNLNHYHGARVRMAYTLNNVQPVLCTLLSDQPYFYMDENISEDDEIAEMEQAIGQLEHDIADMNHKMNMYDSMSAQFVNTREDIIEDFIISARSMTDGTSRFDEQVVFDSIISFMKKSRMAASLMDVAAQYGVAIKPSHQVSGAMFDKDALTIWVNTNINRIDAALLTVRELRRHYQFRQGAMVHPLTFNPDHGILVNRAQRADLAIAMIRAAWELQLAGEKSAWTRIENSSMADLGRAFAREAFLDFRTLNNGSAAAAVFETWFLSERCRAEDKKLIQAMLADYQGYVFGSDQVSRTVSIELLSALGQQPFGKNYLASYAQMIMTDPVFTEVRDRSNANFLWFIKFERSFRETEQELQTDEGISTPDHQSGDLQKNIGKSVHDLGQTSRAVSTNAKPLENAADDANVIHVAFGSFRKVTGEAR